ncbi:hypothetical protein MHM93_14440 [Pseudoalteromonas sp. MM17-2]|uniref:hypothetical protein n=1 Tax=Pseudoalteromonas sp. MM17-2 TaxID=2917753 RepID=UPI001EF4AB45|nr:hypothetical protein [Pseudoalteromonas sp. MM17-2]MCG7545376.1 hypothetical protein [Pseudoalteromonas sp. MM17-2]
MKTNRQVTMIEMMALGIAPAAHRGLTEQEKKYIRDNLDSMSCRQMAIKLDRPDGTIYKYATRLRKSRERQESSPHPSSVAARWKPEVHDQLLRTLIGEGLSIEQIATRMEFGAKTLREKCKELSIARPKKRIPTRR